MPQRKPMDKKTDDSKKLLLNFLLHVIWQLIAATSFAIAKKAQLEDTSWYSIYLKTIWKCQ